MVCWCVYLHVFIKPPLDTQSHARYWDGTVNQADLGLALPRAYRLEG